MKKLKRALPVVMILLTAAILVVSCGDDLGFGVGGNVIINGAGS